MCEDPCARCGAFAMEIPDEDGATSCAVCGESAEDPPDDDDDDYGCAKDEPPPRRPAYVPQVDAPRERPLAEQVNTRISDAASSARRKYKD